MTMKATVDRATFAAALTSLSPAIPPRPNIPVLSSVQMIVAGDSMTLRATDGELAITRIIDVTAAKDGECLVSGLRLRDLVTKFSSPDVKLTAAQGGLEVKSGRSDYRLSGMNASEYPPAPALPPKVGETTLGSLDASLKTIGHAVDDSTPGPCQGVIIESIDETLWIVATDRFRAGLLPTKWLGEAFTARVLFAHLSAAVKNFPPGALSIHADENRVALVGPEASVSMSQIAGDPVKWHAFTSLQTNDSHSVDREDFEHVLARTALVLREDRPIIVDVKNGEAVITTEGENGDGAEHVEFDGDAEIRFGLNPSYMSALLARISEDRINIAWLAANKPMVVTGVGDDPAIHIVMPFRIKE